MIQISSGDSRDIVYTIVDENDAVVDLTDGAISWKILINGTSTAIVTKSVGSGVTLTDASNGVATVVLDPEDTTALQGTYALSGVFTDSGDDVYTFEDGGMEIA